ELDGGRKQEARLGADEQLDLFSGQAVAMLPEQTCDATIAEEQQASKPPCCSTMSLMAER
ncbi:MAG TPA: hypothetical protein QF861_07915, partial [Alphaproteobacteria bacterium]|nr:hypothetical protein [Alphaproteobacteria bacterium]